MQINIPKLKGKMAENNTNGAQLAGKITALGNTALAGAGEALLSEQARAALFGIARRCTYVELSGDADFSRAFPEHLPFEQC